MTKKNKRNREQAFSTTTRPKPPQEAKSNTNNDANQGSIRPLVSICTVTYDRPRALTLLEKRILEQTYPRDRMEWVLIDDSPSNLPDFQPTPNSNLKIVYKRLPEKLKLGKKRNVSNSFCSGDIIVYMDDDDYYPPTRVEHAVQRLTASTCLVAGSTILPILFVPENELWVSGPFNKNHATANTFAFKRELLSLTCFEDDAMQAEEKKFLKDYSIDMVQLEPKHTIICIGHDRNTYEKRQLIQGGKNPRFKRLTDLNPGQTALIEQIATSYSEASSKPATPSSKQRTTSNSATPEDIHFKIIILADTEAFHTERCINSIQGQNYSNFNAVIVAENGSTTGNEKIIAAARKDSRLQVSLVDSGNRSYLAKFLQGIRLLKPNPQDVVITITSDSMLHGQDTLEVIANTYHAKQCLLTYGGLTRRNNNQIITEPLDTRTAMRNDSRKIGWFAPQLRTFKAGLLEFVNPKDLHDNEGNLLRSEGEATLLQALFEISSHRNEYIATPLLQSDRENNNAILSKQSITETTWLNYPYAPAPFINLDTFTTSTIAANLTHQRQQPILWKSTTDSPKISVIIPTKNRPQHLVKAIQFFQSQTWPNKELLILDDSSKKCNDAELIAASDSRIHYCYQTIEESIGRKRRRLCEAATGELIAHFDDDDYYAPNYLETMAMHLLKSNQDFVKLRSWWSIYMPTKTYGFCNTSQLSHTRFYRLSAEGIHPYPNLFSESQLHKIVYGYGFSYVYKRQVLKHASYPDAINHGEDIIFANQCLDAGLKIGLLDDLSGIAIHAIHANNTSSCFAQHIMRLPTLNNCTGIKDIPDSMLAKA